MRRARYSAVDPLHVFLRCRAQIKLVVVTAVNAAVAENFLVLGLALHAVQAVHTAVEYQALGTLERDWLRALRIFEIKQDLQQVVLPQMAVHHLGALARCAWRDGDGQARRQ